MNATEEYKRKHEHDTKEKPLSRAERRLVEDINATHAKLCAQFDLVFLDADDPDSVEVHELVKRLSCKWKVYCHKRNLKPEAHLAVYKYCNDMIEKYRAEIAAQPNPEAANQ